MKRKTPLWTWISRRKGLANAVIVAVIVAWTTHPGRAEQLTDCLRNAKTQVQMTACAGAEAARRDAELNSAYQTLLSRYRNDPAKGSCQRVQV